MRGIEGLGVVVVGGATGTIGRAIAEGLAERGAQVASTGRRGGDAVGRVIEMDVTDPASVADGLDAARAELGRIDAVINTAGITAQYPITETPVDEWNRIIATNLTGAFLVAQQATRILLENDAVDGGRGSITTIASLCALAGCDGVAAYSASKAGVVGLTKTLASELGHVGIRVNALVPGVFLTALNRKRLDGTPRGAGVLSRTPLGRFGGVDELVDAAELLAGRGGRFITGTELVVDGGFLASGITTGQENR